METYFYIWLIASLCSAGFMEYFELKEGIKIPTLNFLIFSFFPILLIIAVCFSFKSGDKK